MERFEIIISALAYSLIGKLFWQTLPATSDRSLAINKKNLKTLTAH